MTAHSVASDEKTLENKCLHKFHGQASFRYAVMGFGFFAIYCSSSSVSVVCCILERSVFRKTSPYVDHSSRAWICSHRDQDDRCRSVTPRRFRGSLFPDLRCPPPAGGGSSNSQSSKQREQRSALGSAPAQRCCSGVGAGAAVLLSSSLPNIPWAVCVERTSDLAHQCATGASAPSWVLRWLSSQPLL